MPLKRAMRCFLESSRVRCTILSSSGGDEVAITMWVRHKMWYRNMRTSYKPFADLVTICMKKFPLVWIDSETLLISLGSFSHSIGLGIGWETALPHNVSPSNKIDSFTTVQRLTTVHEGVDDATEKVRMKVLRIPLLGLLCWIFIPSEPLPNARNGIGISWFQLKRHR